MTALAHELEHDSHPMVGRLQTAEDTIRFIQGGQSTVTLKSARTGQRFTYRVTESDDGQVFFVALLRGPDNQEDYSYFGYIRRGVYFPGGRKAKVHPGAPSAQAFEWTWKHLAKGQLPEALEVWHEGRCGRCNRKLTVPESVEKGFGPECATKVFT
jgi:hypothetical protein